MDNYMIVGLIGLLLGIARSIPQIYIPTLNAFIGFGLGVAIFLFPSKMERVLDIFNKHKKPPPPEIDSGNKEAPLKKSA